MKKISRTASGVSGEYFVAAELSRRGYTCTMTLKNTEHIDILVANTKTKKLLCVQVKTNNGKKLKWLLNKKSEEISDPNFIYIFVNLGKEINSYPNYYIVESKVVSEQLKKEYSSWLAKPGKKGQPHRDTTMREFADTKASYKDNWGLIAKIIDEIDG